MSPRRWVWKNWPAESAPLLSETALPSFPLFLRRLLPLAVFLYLTALPAPACPADTAASVALFPFAPSGNEASPLERIASGLLAAHLDASPDLRVVHGKRLASIAAELGLSASGGLDDADARRVASLAGAAIAVTARTSTMESRLVLYVRIMGVSGTDALEEYVAGPLSGPVRPLCRRLADSILSTLRRRSGEIFAGSGGPAERLARLGEALAGRPLPAAHVAMVETYGGLQRDDSAAAAELSRILREVGFTIAPDRDSAEVVVYGSASGGASPRRGDLVASEVSIELRAVDPGQGRLLAVARKRHTAVDLFASLAGTKAFSEAVLDLAAPFIEETIAAWENPPPEAPAAPVPPRRIF